MHTPTILARTLIASLLLSIAVAKEKLFMLPYEKKEALQELKSTLSSARKTIDISIYSFTNTQIQKALRQRARDGVKIRIIFDVSNLENKFSAIGKLSALKNFSTCTLSGVGQGKITGLMHQKLAIIDNERMIFGSANWSKNAFENSYELLYETDNKALVKKASSAFKRMWASCKPY